MKPALFRAISVSTYALIWLNDRLAVAMVWVIAGFFACIKWLVANIGQFLMRKLTPDQLAEIEGQLQLESQQTELELLSTASQLKDHAVENEEWTEEHTEALNMIGNALLNDCNWDEDAVHGWMRRMIESVPGLSYEEGDPDLLD